MKNALAWCALALVWLGCANPHPRPLAAAKTKVEAPLPLWPAVRAGTLANGLQYFVLHHAIPQKRAALFLVVNAGAMQEDDDQQGLAHFVEHMAFNGTAHFPRSGIVDSLERMGMRFGADTNAFTSDDETVYTLQVPTDAEGAVNTGLDILRDFAGNVTFDPVSVEAERSVVLEEWRLRQGAAFRIGEKARRVLFQGSRYAERTPIGLPDIIRGAPVARLKKFYADWYRPDLMAVIAVGDFTDDAATVQGIATRFASLENPRPEKVRTPGGPPDGTRPRVMVELEPELGGNGITLVNLRPSPALRTPADFRRLEVDRLYNAMLQERLEILSRRTDAPFLGAGTSVGAVNRELDAFTRTARARPGRAEDALRTLLDEELRAEHSGFLQTELDRARSRIDRAAEAMAAAELAVPNATLAHELMRHFLGGEFVVGAREEARMTHELLPLLTLRDVNEAGRGLNGSEGRVALVTAQDPASLIGRERVVSLMEATARKNLGPWTDELDAVALMEKLPAAGTIVKERKLESVGAAEWTLSNGLRVLVKKTDFNADEIVVAARAMGGLAQLGDRDYLDGRFATATAGLGGVGSHSVEGLRTLLAGKAVFSSLSLDEQTRSIRARTAPKDAETMFQLLHLQLTAPRLDETMFKIWTANTAEQLRSNLKTPEGQFQRDMLLALFPGQLRRKPTEPDDLASIVPAKTFAIQTREFGDAAGFVFTVVGNFEEAVLRKLVSQYLATLPVHGKPQRQKDLGIRMVKGPMKREWQLGREPKASVTLIYSADEPFTHDGDNDLYILEQVLELRLRETLRKKLGGVYAVGVHSDWSRSPNQTHELTIGFGCEPGRVDELVKAVLAEIDALAKGDVSADLLARVKAEYVRQREVDLRDNTFWTRNLLNADQFGEDPARATQFLVLERLSAANVQAAAQHYLAGKPFFEGVMKPAGK